MKAGDAGGAPARARAPRHVARYGARWRARDMARPARYRFRRASRLEVMGATWMALGALLTATPWLSEPFTWAGWLPGPGLAAIGAGTWAYGRFERRRR